MSETRVNRKVYIPVRTHRCVMEFDKYFDKATLLAGFGVLFFFATVICIFTTSLAFVLVLAVIDVLLWSAMARAIDDY